MRRQLQKGPQRLPRAPISIHEDPLTLKAYRRRKRRALYGRIAWRALTIVFAAALALVALSITLIVLNNNWK